MRSLHVWKSCQLGVFPKVFQIVVFPFFGKEYVYHNVRVVHGHPVSVCQSDNVNGLLSCVNPCRFLYGVGYGFNLRRRVSLAYYEVTANRAFNAAKVGDGDVRAFFSWMPFVIVSTNFFTCSIKRIKCC